MNRFQKFQKYLPLGLVLMCGLSTFFIYYVLHKETHQNYVAVAFLNVGNGDAVYIESPHHNRILIDGGPPHLALNELRKVMPFYVRSIDTLILTSPTDNHVAGFLDIIDSYHIKRVIEPGTVSTSTFYTMFEKDIAHAGIKKIIAERGMVIHLGDDANLTFLFPKSRCNTVAAC